METVAKYTTMKEMLSSPPAARGGGGDGLGVEAAK